MMHQTIQRADPNGQRVVGVRLSNADEFAWVNEPDYLNILDRCGHTAWFLHGVGGYLYVRTKDRKTRQPVTLARLILGADPRTGVRYANGSRCDLRKRNLYVEGGGGDVTKRKRRVALAA